MTQEVWLTLLWVGAAVLFCIIEAASVQLVSIWLALGALIAAIPAYFGASLTIQFLVFVVVSAIALAVTRPFVRKIVNKKRIRTNLDQVIGEKGVVLQTIPAGGAETGRVKAMGLDWSALSADGSMIAEGQTVYVQRVESVKLIVSQVPPQMAE